MLGGIIVEAATSAYRDNHIWLVQIRPDELSLTLSDIDRVVVVDASIIITLFRGGMAERSEIQRSSGGSSCTVIC